MGLEKEPEPPLTEPNIVDCLLVTGCAVHADEHVVRLTGWSFMPYLGGEAEMAERRVVVRFAMPIGAARYGDFGQESARVRLASIACSRFSQRNQTTLCGQFTPRQCRCSSQLSKSLRLGLMLRSMRQSRCNGRCRMSCCGSWPRVRKPIKCILPTDVDAVLSYDLWNAARGRIIMAWRVCGCVWVLIALPTIADAQTSSSIKEIEPYMVEGLVLGIPIVPNSWQYKRYNCRPRVRTY
jgi:hypothetical protein